MMSQEAYKDCRHNIFEFFQPFTQKPLPSNIQAKLDEIAQHPEKTTLRLPCDLSKLNLDQWEMLSEAIKDSNISHIDFRGSYFYFHDVPLPLKEAILDVFRYSKIISMDYDDYGYRKSYQRDLLSAIQKIMTEKIQTKNAIGG